MLPKADSGSFVLFSLLFVLTLTDPPRTGIDLILIYLFFFSKKEKILLLLLRACFVEMAPYTQSLQLGAERPLLLSRGFRWVSKPPLGGR